MPMQDAATQAAALSTIATTFWVIIGIMISLVLPVAVKTLQRARKKKLELLESSESGESGEKTPSLWEHIVAAWKKYGGNKYLLIFLAAVLVALVLVFILGLEFFTARDAALAGFAWESLINKLFGGADDA